MVELEIQVWFDLASIIVETLIVILLIKTVKDYAEVAKASRLQVKQRFRPWIGPSSGIEFMKEFEGKYQFAVAIKNFGEIPATSVTASSGARTEMPTRDLVKGTNGQSEKLETFMLGPLLPYMEKKYWIFIDPNAMQKAKDGTSQLYTLIHFSYEYEGGKSSYGMISHYNPKSNMFVHKDMWIE